MVTVPHRPGGGIVSLLLELVLTLVCSMSSRFGVGLCHLIQAFNEKSIWVEKCLCVSCLFLVDRLLLLAQDQSLHKQVLCSFCCSAETSRAYEKWRFSSIVNSRENAEALARKQIVSRRCVVMLGEMRRIAEKHYHCSFVWWTACSEHLICSSFSLSWGLQICCVAGGLP